MAKLVKLDSVVVYAGSTVTGQAIVDADVDGVKEVTVKLLGRGQTGWTEHESVYDHNEKKNVTRPVHYSQHEDYCEIQQTLWTSGPGIPLSRGTVFPFAFTLPPDLPPTFKGAYGSIAYTVTVKLRKAALKFDKEESLALTVIPLCSMAHLRNMMEPVVMKKEKELVLLLWKRGYISASVTIPKQVFILGDNILVSADVMNHSSVAVKSTKASIHQTVTYHCSGRKKIEKSVVSKVKKGEIGPGTLFKWNLIPLAVPKSIPPSDFGPRCRLFEASHLFEFVVNPSGMHFDMELNSQLKLGTVWGHPPVVTPAHLPGLPPMHSSPYAPFGPPIPGLHPSPALYPQLPPVIMPSAPPVDNFGHASRLPDAPPSYDEAVGRVEVAQEASELDVVGKDFEKIALSKN